MCGIIRFQMSRRAKPDFVRWIALACAMQACDTGYLVRGRVVGEDARPIVAVLVMIRETESCTRTGQVFANESTLGDGSYDAFFLGPPTPRAGKLAVDFIKSGFAPRCLVLDSTNRMPCRDPDNKWCWDVDVVLQPVPASSAGPGH